MTAPGPALAKLYWTNTGTVTASAASDTQINVAAPYTTGTTSCANGSDGSAQFYCEWATDTGFTTNYGRYPSSGYETDLNSDQNTTWEHSITGLSCGTSYYVRVIYSDPDGVNSCSGADATVNASTWPVATSACPAADTTVGSVTSGSQTSGSITLTATLTGDGDNDGYCEFYYNTTNIFAGATLSSSCSNVTGASAGANRTCEVTGLNASTAYYLWAKYIDPDGVTGGPQVLVTGAPISTLASNNTTTGTVTTSAQTDTSITVTATLTGDANNNGSCDFYYNTSNNFGTATLSSSCTGVSGASAGADRTCSITGLLPGTTYYIWADYIDTDGVTGTDPVQLTGASASTTYTGLGVGTVTTGTVTSSSVVVNAPVDSTNSDTNSNATVQYQYFEVGVGPWTDFGSAVAAKTNQSMPVTGLTASTSYDFRVIWTDANGVYNMSTKASLGSPYTSNTANASTTGGGVCVSTITACSDCHSMPPVDWDGVSAKTGTTGSQGDHGVAAHTGLGERANCALCHFEYSTMTNVTSNARWDFGHINNVLDIYTSNNVPNNVFASPYDKGIKGGYYKGYRANSLIYSENAPGANNVCTATYCHGAGNSPVWGTGSAACGSCHSVPPGASAGKHSKHSNGYIGYKDNSSGTTYDFGCYKCHDPNGHASGPVSSVQAAPVAFDNLSTPKNPSGSYSAGGSAAGTDGTFNWTNGTCSTTYCHSNGAGSNVTNPTWNGGALGCNGCHGGLASDTPTIATNTHTPHVKNVSDPNLGNFTCDKCHNVTTTTGNTITNTAKHVNETPDVAFAGGGSWSGTNCSGTACHTNGRASSPTDLNPAWGGAAIDCTGCHGTDNYYTDINGRPDYQNTGPYPNGHYVSGHVSAATDCIKCHSDTVDSAGAIKASSLHLDGSRDVNLTNAGGGTWDGTTCSGTSSSCHQGITPTWGGTLTCYDCHIDTGTIGTEVDDYTWGSNKATINKLEWDNAGHGRLTASGNYPYTGNSPANFTDCTTNCHTYAVDHNDPGGNYFRLTNSDPNVVCTGCHSTSTTNHHNETVLDANHLNPDAIWTFTPKCVDCHDPHGDNGGVTTNQYNAAMIHSAVNSAGSTSIGAPTGGTTTAVDFPTGFPGGSFVWGSFVDSTVTPSNNGLCQVCHDAADNVNYFNKNTYTTHNQGTVCNSCHTHDKGFAGAGGNCMSCHNSTQNGRPSMQTEFSKVSHHINVAWASMSPSTCSVCHLEGLSDGTINTTYHNKPSGGPYPVDLRVITTVGASEAATISGNTSGIQFFTGNGPNGGTRSAEYTANTFCLGCHDTTNASSNPFNGSESGGSLKTPSAYDGSYGSIEARYADTGTTTSHPYDPNTYNVVPNLTKAYSPHGNPQNNQMKNIVSGGWVNDSQTSANAVGCLDCHNSHGSDALADDGTNFNGITYSSSMGGYKGGLLKTTSTYDPDETTVYSAATDLCFDCHLNTGTGVDSTAPKHASNFGVAATRNVQEYYTAGRWGKNSDSVSSTFSYKTGASTKNAGKISGGHFSASTALAYSASGINGSCMACHDPHGTPTGGYIGTGTTRARMAPALKGTWMSSPYKEDRVGDDQGSYTTNNAYDFSNQIGKRAARENPNFGYNNPANVGAGFGTGWATSNFGKGGTGNDGYFIDDNTFGTQYTYGSGGSPVDVTSTQYKSDATANYITQTSADFGGICLGCHTETNLKALSYSNGTDTQIKVHNTVKGWSTAGNATDLFKTGHSGQHAMGWYIATGFAGQSDRCSTAYLYMPTGYRWSVDAPLNQINQASSSAYADIGSQVTDPPTAVANTQSTSNYKQVGFHQFPCSKCHAPHATKLPRLMKTNCLDIGTTIGKGNSPKHTTSYAYFDCDSGTDTVELKPMVCHGMGPSNTGASNSPSGGGWNIKTGW